VRRLLVTLHRWFGLFAALFLLVAGLTGALISWDHELDEWLNPQLFQAPAAERPLAPLELAGRLEAAEPRMRVRFMPLAVEPGHSFGVFVAPRLDPATGRPYVLGFNQVSLDPASGDILGKREWGAVSLARENLLPFLYKLHYSMHLPDAFGLRLGTLFMGVVAIVWVFDTLLALWISFPSRASWRQSFAFRWRAGGYRLTFDLHRSGGIWLFLLVLTLAVTSVAMNLREQVVRPLVAQFSTLAPSPFAERSAAAPEQPLEPSIPPERILAAARLEGLRRGWLTPPGGLLTSTEFGVYGVGFYAPGNSHGDGGLGNPWLYYDSRSGDLVGTDIPGQGSAGDLFLQAMFPLHSGRIAGLPGRILVSLCGLAVAVLSVTGVLIWAKKRRARLLQARRATAPAGVYGIPAD
jgi:uncharacterized iron-regulated membrane protein